MKLKQKLQNPLLLPHWDRMFFLLILQPSRLRREDVEALEMIQKFVGNNFMKYLIIVFTDKYRLEDMYGILIEEYISTLKPGNALKTLVNGVDNRYINIGYSANLDNPDRILEVKKIISFVEEIKNKHDFLRTQLTERTESIYKRIVDSQMKLKEIGINETNDSKSKLEKYRDYARQEFLEYFLGVAVDAFVRTFQGDIFKFVYKL